MVELGFEDEAVEVGAAGEGAEGFGLVGDKGAIGGEEKLGGDVDGG